MKMLEIYGESSKSLPIKMEGFKLEIDKDFMITDLGYRVDISWLKKAGEKYFISCDLDDYVIEAIPIITASIPNINMQCFLLPDLVEFEPQLGMLRFKTFVGKPIFIEHNNKDVTKAKGVIFDSTITLIKKYGVAKVVILAGVDRTKDPYLAKKILKNKVNCYSMGALARYYLCSICNGVLGFSVMRTCTCYDTDFTDLRSYGKVKEGRLHYLIAKEFYFFETSYVERPADPSAVSISKV